MAAATILDGLAWAKFTEKARIARIAANILSDARDYDRITKKRIHEEVKRTHPPRGRGKAIELGVLREVKRQGRIKKARENARREFKAWKKAQRERSTRLNKVYASRFGRPEYDPSRSTPDHIKTYAERQVWYEAERKRDKGDDCVDLIHQGDYIICLLTTFSRSGSCKHIAVRHRSGGPTVRTALPHGGNIPVKRLRDAAFVLAGPKATSAFTKGKRVQTNWVGQRTLIYHDGSDHVAPQIEELTWRVKEIDLTLGDD